MLKPYTPLRIARYLHNRFRFWVLAKLNLVPVKWFDYRFTFINRWPAL